VDTRGGSFPGGKSAGA